jgi:uncharacterized protein (TIGR00255 family)
MLYSMTGYGRTEQAIGDKNFVVEIRSLNGKQFDLRLLIPPQLKPYEFEIRNKLNEGLERGSVECTITLKQNGAARPVTVNTELLKAYYSSITAVADELQADKNQLLAAILRLPEVVSAGSDILAEEEWSLFEKVFSNAINQLNKHRENEGAVLKQDLLLRVNNIEQHQQQITILDIGRKKKMREGLQKVLEDNLGSENYDKNRLEQELIFYIEKMDISEEQVRLNNHCNYFRTLIDGKEKSKGKKLSFIMQEMGREINTTGAKAYDAEIQKIVVLMKDELEKAKEQVLNVL